MLRIEGSKWYSCQVVSFQWSCFPYVILTNYVCYSNAWLYTKTYYTKHVIFEYIVTTQDFIVVTRTRQSFVNCTAAWKDFINTNWIKYTRLIFCVLENLRKSRLILRHISIRLRIKHFSKASWVLHHVH